MPTRRDVIDTKAPPETVFAFITDLSRRTEWQKALSKCEQTTPGPIGVGTKFEDVSKFGIVKLEVSELESPTRFAYVDAGGPFETRVEWDVHPRESGARVEVELTLNPRGFMKVVWPVVRFLAMPQVEQTLVDLERMLHELS